MFKSGDIVKVLLPNVVNTGYDYRLNAPAELGSFVECRVMNRPYIGVVWGLPDSGLPADKIKSVVRVMDSRLSVTDLQWIKRMSDWTMMTPGAVLKLIVNIPDAFSPPRMEQLYSFNFDAQAKMTQARQSVADAFASPLLPWTRLHGSPLHPRGELPRRRGGPLVLDLAGTGTQIRFARTG